MTSRRIAIIATVPAAADPQFYADVCACDDVEVRVGWDCAQIVEYATRIEADVVIAAGGDGTLNAVARGLLTRDDSPAMAVFPAGTANDFATALAMPLTLAEVIDLARVAPLRAVDVGWVNDLPFINVASAGPAAEATTNVSQGAKKWLGGLAYTIANVGQLADLPVFHVRFEGPEGLWEGEVNGFSVANGALAGGGVRVAPHALITDGRLDLTIAPPLDGSTLGAAITDYFKPAWDAEFDHLVYRQITTMTVQTSAPIRINLDGEPMEGDAFEVRVTPGRLRMVVPDASELVVKPQ